MNLLTCLVTGKTIRQLEKKACSKGYSEAAFMEHAANSLYEEAIPFFHHYQHKNRPIFMLCGKGNNAGDAYALACRLLAKGYWVKAFSFYSKQELSPLAVSHFDSFLKQGGELLFDQSAFSKELCVSDCLIDGVFGSGITGPLQEPFSSVFRAINQKNLHIFSIDVPSGLNSDTGDADTDTLKAKLTISLGAAKIGLFLKQAKRYTGIVKVKGFGLPQCDFLDQDKRGEYFCHEQAYQILKEPDPLSHKYQIGVLACFAGSASMEGAAKLSAKSALKTGAGMVYLFYHGSASQAFNDLDWEIIKKPFDSSDFVDKKNTLDKAHAIVIGPGLNGADCKRELLEKLSFEYIKTPFIVDAASLLDFIELKNKPQKVILTPHFGEFKQLSGYEKDHLDLQAIDYCHDFVHKHSCHLLIKGPVNYLFSTQGDFVVINSGNSSMATAGCGDVLAGMIGSFAAQGYELFQAACLATYLHGKSARIASQHLGSFFVSAQNLIEYFPRSFAKTSSQ